MTAAPRRSVTVLEPGPLTTVQDLGRPGQAALGIGPSGACDRASHALANRLVGNPDGAATLEVTFGGLHVRFDADAVVVTTGARCPGAPHNAPVLVRAGTRVLLGPPRAGLRTYLAVRGGIDVARVLGSRSTDLLGHLGPAVLRAGDVLPIGGPSTAMPGVDVAPVADPVAGPAVLRVLPGPRRDWFPQRAWQALTGRPYLVDGASDRVGIRLTGKALKRSHEGELPSEGMVRGAVQVPTSGMPVLFLADHPVTGGYPVIAYVRDEDVDRCAQLRPGQQVRFSAAQRLP